VTNKFIRSVTKTPVIYKSCVYWTWCYNYTFCKAACIFWQC